MKATSGSNEAMIHTKFPPSIRIGADIRVLKLVYDNKDHNNPLGTVDCEFEDISIGGSISYTAVSYVWGDDTCLHTIIVNGVSVEVRENLWHFLCEMYRQSYTSYLWIDALCINQHDLQERSSQVAIMGRIYSAAANVLVWLGTAPGIFKEERLLGNISVCFPQHNGFLSAKQDRRTYPFAEALLARISDNIYWSRVWVTQEFILASNLELRCGPDSMQGAVLLQLYETVVGSEFPEIWQLRSREKRSWEYMSDYKTPNMYKFIQLRKQWQTRTTPFPLLWHRVGLFSYLGLPSPPRNTECSDPRDRIYSLLSLADAEEYEQTPLYPDYSRSATSLLVELVNRDTRKVEKEIAFNNKGYKGRENPAFQDLEKRALQLARILKIDNPEEASSYAVKNARARGTALHRALCMVGVRS